MKFYVTKLFVSKTVDLARLPQRQTAERTIVCAPTPIARHNSLIFYNLRSHACHSNTRNNVLYNQNQTWTRHSPDTPHPPPHPPPLLSTMAQTDMHAVPTTDLTIDWVRSLCRPIFDATKSIVLLSSEQASLAQSAGVHRSLAAMSTSWSVIRERQISSTTSAAA